MNLKDTLRLAAVLSFLGIAGCSVQASTCNVDSSLACVSGATGYSCTGDAQPEDSRSDLICSTDNGAGQYCCYSSSCSYDSSVPCSYGAGYSCDTGSLAPDQVDPTLVCSVPTAAGNLDLYCCYTAAILSTTGTCAQDPSVVCPQAYSYGFSCSGSDTPDQDFSNLTCSAPTAGNLYCCVYQ
jgi:hypothetical protein